MSAGKRAPLQLAILISGRGSNMAAIARDCLESRICARVAVVIADVPGAPGIALARAMGIEALSRGAALAIFVDSDPRCAECVRENLRRARLRASVQVMDALKFLELYAEEGFDLIFADPPYKKSPAGRDFASDLLRLPSLVRALRSHGKFVLERAAGSKDPEGGLLSLVRLRR